MARQLPGACGASDRRSRQQHVRVGPPVGADRYHRQQAERHAGTRSRDSMGGHGNEQGRPRERAHRARHGAEMGARKRERGDCRAGSPLDHDARPRRQRRHDRRRHPGRGARRPDVRRAGREGGVGARKDRAVQRAVYQLRRDREIPIGRTVSRRTSRRGRDADSRGRPGRPPHAAHRRPAVRERREENPGSRDFRRGRRPPAADGRPRQQGRRPPEDGGTLRGRRRIGQRRRRDPRPRAAGRSRRRQRPPRFVGCRRRRDRRWRWMRGDVGSAADHEEAEPPPAAHGSRGALDERGERRPRRSRVSRSAPRGARQARDDAGIGRRRLPTARVRVHRERRGRGRR